MSKIIQHYYITLKLCSIISLFCSPQLTQKMNNYPNHHLFSLKTYLKHVIPTLLFQVYPRREPEYWLFSWQYYFIPSNLKQTFLHRGKIFFFFTKKRKASSYRHILSESARKTHGAACTLRSV